MKKVIPIVLTTFVVPIVSGELNSAGATQYISVDGSTLESGGISGFAGAATSRGPGANALLYSIGGGERGDHPCYVEFGWWRFTEEKQETTTTKWWQPPCADEHHSFLSTALAGSLPPSGGLAYGISDVQGCFSGQRLKGVRINKKRAIGDGGVQADVSAGSAGGFDRANCHENDWRPASHCPAGKVAVAVNIIHSDDGVTGLELLCASAKATSTAPPQMPQYSLDANTVHLTNVSGFKGTSQRIGSAVAKGYALTSLRSRERSDQACYLESTSDQLREPLLHGGQWPAYGSQVFHNFQSDSADRCGGGTPSDEVKVTAIPTQAYLVEHSHDVAQTLIRGMRICMNNDRTRLKGLELRGRSVGADQSGKFRIIDVPLDPKQASGARANCGKDGWQPWVECSTGEVATGVVAHFEAGDSPRAVTGLALECAQVKQSP